MFNLIPKPASLTPLTGEFILSNQTVIQVDQQIEAIGQLLANSIETYANIKLQVAIGNQGSGHIHLALIDDPKNSEEGYELSITPESIQIKAFKPTGLFYGVQTFCQLLTSHLSTLSPHLHLRQVQVSTTLRTSLPAVSITDSPRFRWRGAMLDVARHFFSVDDVKHYIDLISHYKINILHLHLTDDQGWRIEIKSWPKLTEIGSRTQVNGGGGGFYTQEQFKEIVAYAQSRHVMIIPEIDTPGHTNAALASYDELNASEEATDPYEGTEVGFSTLNINSEITYQFLDDVIREISAISPAPYIHIGGDEAKSTPEDQYKYFIKRFQEIVYSHNKAPVGWAEIGETELDPRTIAQHWQGTAYQDAKKQGCKIVLSPANKTYLDMKYDEACSLGLDWAGFVSVKDSYDWEPDNYMHLLEEADILGIEAPIWTETLLNMKDIEFMAFPRLPGLAELAWSPKGQCWDDYKPRLAKHGQHMQALNINYFKSPDVEWE